MSRGVLFGGGVITDDAYVLRQIQPKDVIICADSGYLHAKRLGIKPDFLVGDFDSYTEEKPADCRIVSADSHKDETDTLMGVKLGMAEGCQEFLLFGMTGGRLDHTMANMQVLRFLAEQGISAAILDADTEIYVVKDSSLTVSRKEGYSLSVFSLDAVSYGVTLKNTAYPLDNYTMSASFPIGVSNEFLTEAAQISVKNGCLAVMVCRL